MAAPTNEPDEPPCMGPGSLAFTPTAGARVAPELLVLELFRELGQGDVRGEAGQQYRDFKDIIDNRDVISPGARILLSACRGRTAPRSPTGRGLLHASVHWADGPRLVSKEVGTG